MSWFDKKGKSESVKVLSEKDIQNKLYGKYRANSDTTFAPVIPPPKPASQAIPKTKESVAGTDDLFSSAAKDVKTESPMVIKPEAPSEGLGRAPEGIVKPKETANRETIGRWVREENKTSLGSSTTLKKDEKFQHKKVIVAPQKAESSWKPLFEKSVKSIGGVFQDFFGLLAGGVRSLVDLLLKLISGIDLSNPRVRQALYWLSVGGVLAAIFVGIHALNDKREVAMKSPSKTTHAVTVHKTVALPLPPKADATTESPTVPLEVVKSPEKTTAVPPEMESSAAEPAAPIKVFVVQVATYVNEDDAQQIADSFRGAAFTAFVKVQRRSEGKHFYSVYLGPYDSFRRAQEDLAKFKKNEVSKPFQDAFIRSMAQ